MGYSTLAVVLPAVLDEDELFAGVCKAAGHSLARPDFEIWRAGGRRGFAAPAYCRRCVRGLVCKAAGHDLTNPDNVVRKVGACALCKNDRQREYNRRLSEHREQIAQARAALKTSDLQALLNTTGPAPRWLVSGWVPREVDWGQAQCAGADSRLFDAIEKTETVMEAEARLFKAASLCSACPVREACARWAQDRYLVHRENRVAGGMYFGPRKSVQFAKDSQMISWIRVA
jgi:hypothetical protein